MRYLAIFFLCIFLAVGYAAYDAYHFLNTPVEQPGSDTHFEVERGATFDRVAWDLKKAGLITDVKRFQLLGRYKKSLSSIKAGEYILSTSLTPPQVLEQLLKGQAHLVRLTIREGLPWWETAKAIEKQGFATYEDFKAVIHDPDFLARHAIPFDNAEGFLFPDTYLLNKPKKLDKEQAEYIASLLVQTFWKKNIPFWRLLEASPAPNDSFGAKVNDITSETPIDSLGKLAEYSHLVVMRAPLPQADEFAIAYEDELLDEDAAEDDSSAESSTAKADKASDKPDNQSSAATTAIGEAQGTSQTPADEKGDGNDTKAQNAHNQQSLSKKATGSKGTGHKDKSTQDNDNKDKGSQDKDESQSDGNDAKDEARDIQGLSVPLSFFMSSAYASATTVTSPQGSPNTSPDTSPNTNPATNPTTTDTKQESKPDTSTASSSVDSSASESASTSASTSSITSARATTETTALKNAKPKASQSQKESDKEPQSPLPDSEDAGGSAQPKNTAPHDAPQKAQIPSKETQATAPLPAVWPAGALPSKMPKHPPQNPSEIDKDALRQALTLASLVEKETGLPTERPRVAGVYTNRIQKNMLLQCDPTIIYGIGPSFSGPIRRSHLKDATNLYNTYIHPGLPPSPICSFGVDAFASALLPEQHGYLYFVATGLGKDHTFSKNLREHNRAVSVYRARMRSK